MTNSPRFPLSEAKPLPRPDKPRLRALAFVGLATIAAWIHGAFLEAGPIFSFYYLAVVFSAVYGGIRSAIWATLLASVSAFFIFDSGSPTVRSLHLLLFTAVAALLIAVVGRLHRVAQQVDESERRFIDMLTRVKLLVQMLDRDGGITHCNNYMLTVTGWREGELIGRNVFDTFVPPQNLAEAKKLHEALLQDDPAAWHFDMEILTKDGSVRLVRWSNTVLRGTDGRVVGTASIGQDITDERRAQFADKLLASVVESTDDAVIATSLDGVVTSWNPSAERIFGYRAAEIVGQSIFLLVPKDRIAEAESNLEQIARGERIQQLETVRLSRDGRLVDVSVTISPIRNDKGSIIGSSAIARDISDRKAADLTLRELSRKLFVAEELERGRIAKELHDSTAQNLIAVMMSLDTVRESVSARSTHDARQIEDCLAILESSTHEIRTLSYLLHPARFDEAGLAGALQHYVAGFAERTNIETTLDLPPDFQRLSSEVEMVLFRLVQEALGNIHRHAHANTAIVRLSRNSTHATLEVRDDGCGMQVDPSGHPIKTGVGIAGMRERMRQIGGSFDIESGPQGTIVRATAPVMRKVA